MKVIRIMAVVLFSLYLPTGVGSLVAQDNLMKLVLPCQLASGHLPVGSSFTVEIRIENAAALYNEMLIAIEYDAEYLAYDASVPPELVSMNEVIQDTAHEPALSSVEGNVGHVLAYLNGIPTGNFSGGLLNLTFKVVKCPGTEINVNMKIKAESTYVAILGSSTIAAIEHVATENYIIVTAFEDPDVPKPLYCDVPVNCNLEPRWRNARNSAVYLESRWNGDPYYVYDGSGIVVNQVQESKRMLILTAKHVVTHDGVGLPALRNQYPDTLYVHFNRQTFVCNNYCREYLTDSVIKAVKSPSTSVRYAVVAEGNFQFDVSGTGQNVNNDYSLLEIVGIEEWNKLGVCYSGWNTDDAEVVSGSNVVAVAIGHPNGILKSISKKTGFVNESPSEPYWNIFSLTEGNLRKGSSGCGLWTSFVNEPLVGLASRKTTSGTDCSGSNFKFLRFSHIFQDPAVRQALTGGANITELGSFCGDGANCFNGIMDEGETETDCCRTLDCHALTGCPKCHTTTGLGGPTNEDFNASVIWSNLPGPCLTPGVHENTVYANSSPDVGGYRIIIEPSHLFEEIELDEVYHGGSANITHRSYRLSMPDYPVHGTAKLVTFGINNSYHVVSQKPFTILPHIIADAGSDANLCLGHSVLLGGNTSFLSGANYRWTVYPKHGQAFLSDPRSSNPIFAPTQNGNYTIYLQTFGGAYCGDNDVVRVSVSPCNCGQQPHTAWVGMGSCLEGRLNLAAGTFGTGTPPYSYRWEPGAPLSNPFGENPFVLDVSQTRTYTVTITDANFCVATATVTVPQNAAVPGPIANKCGTYTGFHSEFRREIFAGNPICQQLDIDLPVIPSGSTSEWVATERIRLLPGFRAETGSRFIARIGECPPFPPSSGKIAAAESIASAPSNLLPKPEISLYPNPYSREVTFGFVMPESGRVTVKVSDMMGRLVAVPWENKEIGAGVSSWVWDGSGLSDGVYVVSVSAGPTTQTLKLIKAGK